MRPQWEWQRGSSAGNDGSRKLIDLPARGERRNVHKSHVGNAGHHGSGIRREIEALHGLRSDAAAPEDATGDRRWSSLQQWTPPCRSPCMMYMGTQLSATSLSLRLAEPIGRHLVPRGWDRGPHYRAGRAARNGFPTGRRIARVHGRDHDRGDAAAVRVRVAKPSAGHGLGRAVRRRRERRAVPPARFSLCARAFGVGPPSGPSVPRGAPCECRDRVAAAVRGHAVCVALGHSRERDRSVRRRDGAALAFAPDRDGCADGGTPLARAAGDGVGLPARSAVVAGRACGRNVGRESVANARARALRWKPARGRPAPSLWPQPSLVARHDGGARVRVVPRRRVSGARAKSVDSFCS